MAVVQSRFRDQFMPNKYLFFVVGATNVGKSTFLNAIKLALGKQVHLVEVGKWMRAKYPPEHFQGQAAPAHTQEEALHMLFGGIREGEANGSTIILVDGQPRDIEQAREIMAWSEKDWTWTKATIHLVCPREERERRARLREPGNAAALQLSLDRLDRDVLSLHEVLIRFNWWKVHMLNTADNFYRPFEAFVQLLSDYGGLRRPMPEMSAASHENRGSGDRPSLDVGLGGRRGSPPKPSRPNEVA